MLAKVTEKLQWPLLLERLADCAQSVEGRQRCLSLPTNLTRHEIEERWALVDPLRLLATQGYSAPIGELPPLSSILKSASLGQILAGEELSAVRAMLESVKSTHSFAADFAGKCTTLMKFKARLYPMPHIESAIARAVTPEGHLRDDASDELMRIRRQKVQVRKRIEEQLTQILHDSAYEAYVQDDFFTVRGDRYVVPIRIDGKGRVKGTIRDTSDSGQTLFIEPTPISGLNDQLQEIELAEKLEIIRIFRVLSEMVAADAETLGENYREMVALDALTAQALLAESYDGNPVQITDEPGINLTSARHPLVKTADGRSAVANHMTLDANQHVLIVSGPNAGGKTVVLKTVGLLHVMAKAGLLLPADQKSKIFLFEQIHLEMGDAQSLTANLSTFTGHLLGLKPIIEGATAKDLVLLDELAVGTDPQTGAAIARSILDDLADRKTSTLITTHFDALKGLAVGDRRFRNGSMEFSLDTLTPTYKLILDVPGQSYGLEVAEKLGLPARIIERAKELRGTSASSLDSAVSQLMQARDRSRAEEEALKAERRQAEAAKDRWEQERQLLDAGRAKAVRQLADSYEAKMIKLRGDFDELVKKLKKAQKRLDQQGHQGLSDGITDDRKGASTALRNMEKTVDEMKSAHQVDDIPGKPCTRADLKVGHKVYVIPLKKTGTVVQISSGDQDPIEVEVGVIKLRVSIHDLRKQSPQDASGSQKKQPAKGHGRLQDHKSTRRKETRHKDARQNDKQTPSSGGKRDDEIVLTLQTPTNSLDLRGKDTDDAVAATWTFIDKALLRGESHIIVIHGHGEGRLKSAIREALRDSCPYDVSFRPGLDQEGGDGVTVVNLRT